LDSRTTRNEKATSLTVMKTRTWCHFSWQKVLWSVILSLNLDPSDGCNSEKKSWKHTTTN
jgi:hypothetical protein